MKLGKILRGLLAVAVVGTGALVVTAQPASAATIAYYAIYSENSVDNGTPRAMAILNASTGNTAPMVQAPYTAAAPYNDIMVLEIEPGNVGRIKPYSTWSNDGNPHNDKCLAIKNNRNAANQPIVNATCTYDNVDNDVWDIEKQQVIILPGGGTRTLYRFSSHAYNWCIRATTANTNSALETNLCGLSGTDWLLSSAV